MSTISDLKIPYTWEERRPVMLEKFLYIPSHYDEHDQWEKTPFFENDHPLVIEYCSGNGQWIADQAKKNPHLNFIAVEMKFQRAQKTWKKMKRETLSNLFVVCGEALTFTKYYIPEGSVAKVYVNFPDPWPKLRHAKHRLIRGEFLLELEKVVRKDVQLYFTTDDLTYLKQMMKEVGRQPKWKSRFEDPFYQINLSDFGDSYFLNLWQAKGRTIYHLSYEVHS